MSCLQQEPSDQSKKHTKNRLIQGLKQEVLPVFDDVPGNQEDPKSKGIQLPVHKIKPPKPMFRLDRRTRTSHITSQSKINSPAAANTDKKHNCGYVSYRGVEGAVTPEPKEITKVCNGLDNKMVSSISTEKVKASIKDSKTELKE